MHLIIPMAGKSSRFPDLKPKWMLTHPSGNFMVLEAIAGLNLFDFEKIHFIYLKEHERIHNFLKGFKEEIEDMNIMSKVEFIELDEPTKDQPHTVYEAIRLKNIKGPIFIKDSDNRFSYKYTGKNVICYEDLNDVGLIKPKNKSYIQANSEGTVINIIEKQVISSNFCVGGYGFESANQYTAAYDALDSLDERYISNLIYHQILAEKVFMAEKVKAYSDWGTVEDWDRFKRSYATLFVDLDGTLVQNSSWHFPPYIGESEPLKNNVEIIKLLQQSGKFEIIITTSRPHKFRETTEKQLQNLGIKYTYLLMNLNHSKRIIINDYSKSNPYKSCDAINLKRNADDLKEILRESLGIDYEEI
ncbi:MAG TPA: hypothetical protein VF622_07395 [Segetibacter sp.]